MVGISSQITDATVYFRSLKGRCLGNQVWGNIAYPPSFVALAFRNGLEDRNSDFKN